MRVVFVDPPEKNTNRLSRTPAQAHPWETIAEQLRENPRRWALCLRDVQVQAAQVNHGRIVAFRPAGHYQARTVQTHNRDTHGRPLIDLYIKYEPPTPEEN